MTPAALIVLLHLSRTSHRVLFFFFNDTATTEIYTLSLHDALPILMPGTLQALGGTIAVASITIGCSCAKGRDRKSTRLNSSHGYISYAVFCLKKKKTISPCSVHSFAFMSSR